MITRTHQECNQTTLKMLKRDKEVGMEFCSKAKDRFCLTVAIAQKNCSLQIAGRARYFLRKARGRDFVLLTNAAVNWHSIKLAERSYIARKSSVTYQKIITLQISVINHFF